MTFPTKNAFIFKKYAIFFEHVHNFLQNKWEIIWICVIYLVSLY